MTDAELDYVEKSAEQYEYGSLRVVGELVAEVRRLRKMIDPYDTGGFQPSEGRKP